MPDLHSDFVGRVNRLALKPSDKTCLVPVMEAMSNSIQAITESYRRNLVTSGIGKAAYRGGA